MKPEDYQNTNQSTEASSPPQPNNQPQVESSINNAIVGENVIQPINNVEASFPNVPPISPDVAKNIYPDESNPAQPRPLSSQSITVDTAPKKKKKGLIVGLIIVGALVFLGGGSAAAYTFWYSSPEKVISDSIINAITAKTSIYTGDINVESDDVKMTVNLTSKQDSPRSDIAAKVSLTVSGKTYSTSGSAIVDGTGDAYIKADIANIAAAAKEYIGSMASDVSFNATVSTAIDKFVSNVSNKWIKISSSDLAEYSKDYSTAKDCVNDTIKKYNDDKAAIAELTDLYSKQAFIVSEKVLGQKDGSIGFKIKTDKTKLKAFVNGLKDTKIYKSINSCDKSYSVDDLSTAIDKETSVSDSNVSVELWSNTFTHNVTKLYIDGESSGSKVSAQLLPKFNEKVEIAAPASSITLKQFMAYSEDLYSSIFGGSITN